MLTHAAGGGPGVVAEVLARAGYNRAAIAGLLGNFQIESGFQPGIRNRIGAYGLGQWLGGRQQALFRRYGAHPTLQQEAQFVVSELGPGGPYSNVGTLLHRATSPTQAAYLVNQQYEISGSSPVPRETAASQFYRSMGKGGALRGIAAPIHPLPPPVPTGIGAGRLTRTQRIKIFDYLVAMAKRYNPGALNWQKALQNDLANAGFPVYLAGISGKRGIGGLRSFYLSAKNPHALDTAILKVYRQYAKGTVSIDPGPGGTAPAGPSLNPANAIKNAITGVLDAIAKPLENFAVSAALVLFGAMFVLMGIVMLAHSGGASIPATTDTSPSTARGGAAEGGGSHTGARSARGAAGAEGAEGAELAAAAA